MVEPETRPLVVCEPTGAPVDVVRENDKGFRKSIESGNLWSLHRDTGRLLPYAEGVAARVEDHGTWYRAVLGEAGAGAADRPASLAETSGPVNTHAAGDDGLGAVLAKLVDVIRDRRAEMPEGSYTTHLFSAGGSKIRKKTGEEAVELILSETREELTSEAADLLYHLLVLLEFEEISPDEVAAELKRR